jgi:RES domain-containing protein
VKSGQPSALTLWRISTYESLDGAGAFRVGGRWNTPGHAVVYLADSPAAAMLETLVHLTRDDNALPDSFRLMRVEFSVAPSIATLDTSAGPAPLRTTQKAGDTWLEGGESAIARVTSVVVPLTWNYLLNPHHADAANATVVEISKHLYDPRLLRRKGQAAP